MTELQILPAATYLAATCIVLAWRDRTLPPATHLVAGAAGLPALVALGVGDLPIRLLAAAATIAVGLLAVGVAVRGATLLTVATTLLLLPVTAWWTIAAGITAAAAWSAIGVVRHSGRARLARVVHMTALASGIDRTITPGLHLPVINLDLLPARHGERQTAPAVYLQPFLLVALAGALAV